MKLLALEVNPEIPNCKVQSKPKSTKRKFAGTQCSMPAPPSKKSLAALDASLVESGELQTGIPCVPVTIEKRVKGKLTTTEVHSRKFPLVDIRQRLLKRHEKFMRLHTTKEITAMCHDDLVDILKGMKCIDVSAKSTEELRQQLDEYESKHSLWIWHDHSSLASHGIIAVMVGVVYNPVLFLSESESPGVQEFVEEGEIHFIAHGSSSLADQACLIPERLAELEGLNEPLCTAGGIQIADTLKYFKGDKPAAEFEAGISCGGSFPCVGCVCSSSRLAHSTIFGARHTHRSSSCALEPVRSWYRDGCCSCTTSILIIVMLVHNIIIPSIPAGNLPQIHDVISSNASSAAKPQIVTASNSYYSYSFLFLYIMSNV